MDFFSRNLENDCGLCGQIVLGQRPSTCARTGCLKRQIKHASLQLGNFEAPRTFQFRTLLVQVDVKHSYGYTPCNDFISLKPRVEVGRMLNILKLQ